MNGAAGTIAGMGREAENAFRDRMRDWVGGLDMVSPRGVRGDEGDRRSPPARRAPRSRARVEALEAAAAAEAEAQAGAQRPVRGLWANNPQHIVVA